MYYSFSSTVQLVLHISSIWTNKPPQRKFNSAPEGAMGSSIACLMYDHMTMVVMIVVISKVATVATGSGGA